MLCTNELSPTPQMLLYLSTGPRTLGVALAPWHPVYGTAVGASTEKLESAYNFNEHRHGGRTSEL